MEHLFVPQNIALLAKDKGFNGECFTYFNTDGDLELTSHESGDEVKYPGDYKFDACTNDCLEEYQMCTAPIYQQLIDWFGEKHDIEIHLERCDDGYYQVFVRKWEFNTITTENHNGEMTNYDNDGYVTKYDWCVSIDKQDSYNTALIEAFKLIK